jgi:hypothetical protein
VIATEAQHMTRADAKTALQLVAQTDEHDNPDAADRLGALIDDAQPDVDYVDYDDTIDAWRAYSVITQWLGILQICK